MERLEANRFFFTGIKRNFKQKESQNLKHSTKSNNYEKVSEVSFYQLPWEICFNHTDFSIVDKCIFLKFNI